MSDSYTHGDVRMLVGKIERIIESAKYGDPAQAAVRIIERVLTLPDEAEGIHLQGFRAYDIDDIRGLLETMFKRATWNSPGQTLTGKYVGNRTTGWRYKTRSGQIETEDGGVILFSLPEALSDQLCRVPHGSSVTITYVGHVERKKAFTVEVRS
jgi:hypothetical protein